jgi:hypothetical protein
MPELKNIDTAVLLTMLTAHSANYRRVFTKKEIKVCRQTRFRLRSEIELRQKGRTVIAIGRTVLYN